ncbi:MAG: hypothetical protein J7502_18625, partial [Flavisolibacter sp.]|nr:hypothetical protein [Flavisolibacter sp.]
CVMWRMCLSLRLLLKSLLLIVGVNSFAQTVYTQTSFFNGHDNTGCKPPFNRRYWHDLIDSSQRNALKAFQGSSNEEVKYYVEQALTKHIDDLQCFIEKDSLTKDQPKIGYLKGLDEAIKKFTTLYKNKQFNASQLPLVLDAYQECMMKDAKRQSIEEIIERSSYEVADLLVKNSAFRNNPGIRASQNAALKKYLNLHPEQILSTLKKYPELPFRDSMIKIAARQFPLRLYDYAAARDSFGDAILNVKDSLVMAIAKMARGSKSGQLYFPFLDNIIAGKITLENIDQVKNDNVKYYKLLVQTRLDYIGRILNGDQIISMATLDTMLFQKAKEPFINTINELHEKPDAVRFAILEQLNAQELYYLAIQGETELYTSSFVKGVFPKMLAKFGNRGDSLLASVGFDRFKKFLKMCAGYNTLSNFLASIPDKDRAQLIMTAFVNNLEKSKGLEDGVDVADSYASINETIKPVADEMLYNVKLNLDRNIKENNKRGIVMYNLLYKLFLSVDSTKNVDLTKEFGIPPVYSINYKTLVDDSAHKVVMQVFFYGDDDGKMSYNGFISDLNRAGWKIAADTKYWLAYSSPKGQPVVIYANKWFNDEKEEGVIEKAQGALRQYLEGKNIQPTIVVHRGHSYWVPSTIEQIRPAAKVVLLGSCGGYNVIHNVLQHAPDAHIIASKQTGKKDINQPFMNILNERLRNGSNIDWIPLWKEFKAKAGNVDGFDDYVPPYKNLGALFIKAYN